MKQRIFSHFQDYLIQYISHQYQNLLYCNSSQYCLSTYNSQHNDIRVVHCVFNPDHYMAQSLLTQHYYINESTVQELYTEYSLIRNNYSQIPRLTMSNWSSETVSQRSDNIITKGKNDKTIKWSTTDYIHSFCIRFFYVCIYICML